MKIQQIISNITNSNFVKNHISKSAQNPKFLARTLLLTSVSKDVFAYGLRVHNTLCNEHIPEDKKEFSAKMDASSAVVTAVSQIAAGFMVSSDKFQNFCTNKLFKSLKNSPDELKNAQSAFSALSTLVLASLVAKRIATPLIASKIASKHKKDKAEI